MFRGLLLTMASFALFTSANAAPDNLATLKQFKVATTDLNIPVVAQEGKNADAIRENLKRIKLYDMTDNLYIYHNPHGDKVRTEYYEQKDWLESLLEHKKTDEES